MIPEMTYECPVCGAGLQRTHYADDVGRTEEENLKCSNCDRYAYQYAYGSGMEWIGAITIAEHYSDTEEEREHCSRVLDMAIRYEREQWDKEKNGEIE